MIRVFFSSSESYIIAPDKVLFSSKKHLFFTLKNNLWVPIRSASSRPQIEALLVCTHNICFREEIRKIFSFILLIVSGTVLLLCITLKLSFVH